jgi:hypothetical protein
LFRRIPASTEARSGQKFHVAHSAAQERKIAGKIRGYNNAMDLANTLIERPATLDEAEQVIDTLWCLLQAYRERLELNSSNSSLPPSLDRLSGKAKDRHPRKPSGKSRGAQAGHIVPTRDLVPEAEVDRIERYFPETRCECGGEIRIDPTPTARHQVFDLPEISYSVTEHQRFAGTCRCCRRAVSA